MKKDIFVRKTTNAIHITSPAGNIYTSWYFDTIRKPDTILKTFFNELKDYQDKGYNLVFEVEEPTLEEIAEQKREQLYEDDFNDYLDNEGVMELGKVERNQYGAELYGGNYISKDKIRKLMNLYKEKVEEREAKEEKEWKNMNEAQKAMHNVIKEMYSDYYYAYKELLEEK